jgi:hypothetical protein
MKGLVSRLAISGCVLALSAGVAFADNLHNGQTNTTGTSTTGQTGTQAPTSSKPAIASCGVPQAMGTIGSGAKVNSGNGSPFSMAAESAAPPKKYAGAGAGNSASNPKANSQYDNACAQAQLH